MLQWIGIILLLGIYKKIKPLLKDKRSIIKILIALIIIRNLGFIGIMGHSGLSGLILGFINGGILLSIFSLISKGIKRDERSLAEEQDKSEESDDGPLPGERELPPPAQIPKRTIPLTPESLNAVTTQKEKDTAAAAVRKYLQNRNYRVLESEDPVFDLIAIDGQNNETKISIIAFKYNNNENKIYFNEDKFDKIVDLGRKHRLFIVTDCSEDEDSKYLGNYVTIYYLDNPIDETGFIKQGNRYINNLRKIKKFSYDQEISVKLNSIE